MQQHNHSAEPWCVALKEERGQTHIYDKDGCYLGSFIDHESAKRAAVCVNACTWIPTDTLQKREFFVAVQLRRTWASFDEIARSQDLHKARNRAKREKERLEKAFPNICRQRYDFEPEVTTREPKEEESDDTE